MHPNCARVLVLLLLPTVAACTDFGRCVGGREYAITIEMRPTLVGVASGTAFGAIQEGAYTDSLRLVALLGADTSVQAAILAAGIGRPGTYAASIRRSGFANWDTSGVQVREGECALATVSLRVKLEPAP
jgi:hypothetical protein